MLGPHRPAPRPSRRLGLLLEGSERSPRSEAVSRVAFGTFCVHYQDLPRLDLMSFGSNSDYYFVLVAFI